MTAVDQFRVAASSARWPLLVGAPIFAGAALLMSRATAGPVGVGIVGLPGRALVCVSLAFLVDDPALTAAPAAAVSARRRFVARATLGVPVVVLGWMGVLGVEALLTPWTPSADPLPAVALATLALGLAAAVSRRFPEPSPGAVGAIATAALAEAIALVPRSWASHAPDGTLLATVLVLFGLASAWASTAEPRP